MNESDNSNRSITTKDFNRLINLSCCNYPKTIYLVFSKSMWQRERENIGDFAWSDEELEKAENNDGIIGKKGYVTCLISMSLPEITSINIEENQS